MRRFSKIVLHSFGQIGRIRVYEDSPYFILSVLHDALNNNYGIDETAYKTFNSDLGYDLSRIKVLLDKIKKESPNSYPPVNIFSEIELLMGWDEKENEHSHIDLTFSKIMGRSSLSTLYLVDTNEKIINIYKGNKPEDYNPEDYNPEDCEYPNPLTNKNLLDLSKIPPQEEKIRSEYGNFTESMTLKQTIENLENEEFEINEEIIPILEDEEYFKTGYDRMIYTLTKLKDDIKEREEDPKKWFLNVQKTLVDHVEFDEDAVKALKQALKIYEELARNS